MMKLVNLRYRAPYVNIFLFPVGKNMFKVNSENGNVKIDRVQG